MEMNILSTIFPANFMKSTSKITLIISFLIILFTRINGDTQRVLTWDVFGYYLYLPSIIKYNDPNIQNDQWLLDIMDTYKPSGTLYQINHLNDNKKSLRYPIGMAVLNLPFYLGAEAINQIFNLKQSQVGPLYQWAWIIGGLFYTFIGLFYLRKTLLHFFNENISSLSLALIIFGTNYFQMTAYAGNLPHQYLFSLINLLIWLCIKRTQNHKINLDFGIGILGGLITITRPNEIVVMLIPLMFGIISFQNILPKIQYWFNNLFSLAGMFTGGFIIVIIQLIYWKITTGQWVFYSYDDPGVGFDFLNPHTYDFLFSFRKGWFIYTPLALIAIFGIFIMARKRNPLAIPSLLFLFINLYIISSWTCWWYAGASYSSRSMVSSYGILAIGLGYFFTVLLEKNNKIKVIGFSSVILIVALNLFQMWQFNSGIIDGERMTWDYYKKVFLKTQVNEEYKKYLLVERSTESIENFIPDNKKYESRVLSILEESTPKNDSIFILKKESEFALAINESFENLASNKEYFWIRLEAEIWLGEEIQSAPLLVISFHHKEKSYKYRTSEYLISGFKPNSWNKIQMDYMSPEPRNKKDNLKIYWWNRKLNETPIKGFKITQFIPYD